MDQDAAGRLVKVLLAAHGDVFQGLHQVQHIPRAHVQTQAAQHLFKEHEVVEYVAGRLAVLAE